MIANTVTQQNKKFPIGVVLGKFMPPHHGHRLVIQTALAQADKVHVIVCRQVEDSIPAEQRVEWLQALYPEATVTVLEVTFPVTDAAGWAAGTLQTVGQRPAAVFTSEDYGHRLAELLQCAHILVDQARTEVPISASQIRQDPQRYREYLDPLVWQYFQAQLGA